MERVAFKPDGSKLRVGDAKVIRVRALIEVGANLQPSVFAISSSADGLSSDQVNDDLSAATMPAAPVDTDAAKQAMLDLVPLARG